MPVTRYASAGDVQVAYQVVGAGPHDLVFVTSWSSHLEIQWEEPLIASFLTRRLAGPARVVRQAWCRHVGSVHRL